MSILVVRILIILIGLAGLVISVLFALTAQGKVAAGWRLVPQFCRMEGHSCRSLLATREGRLLGIPNYYPGIIFYLAAIGTGLFTSLDFSDIFFQMLVVLTLIAVVAGAYLIFALLFTLKINCPLCYASHALNFLLLAILIIHSIILP